MDKRIIINETDSTTSGAALSSTDIVYVPGFCRYKEEEGEGATKKTYGKYGQPVLCTSLAQFKETFGDRPAYFTSKQNYPKAVFEGEGSTRTLKEPGFAEVAIPESANGKGDNAEGSPWFGLGDPDPSYLYACELLAKGIPVLYERMNKLACTATDTDVTVAKFYERMLERFSEKDEETADPNHRLLNSVDLPIKYFTSGGYPSFEYYYTVGDTLASKLIEMASDYTADSLSGRGDAIALIDHTNKKERVLFGANSVFSAANAFASIVDSKYTYGAIFTPWANYSFSATYNYDDASAKFDDYALPGSFAYLACLANVLKTSPSWSTIAGVVRGQVPGLASLSLADNRVLTNAIANKYQPEEDNANYKVCINGITNIKGYGYCIWGNRTLRRQGVGISGYALNFLNIRNLICDIKKLAYDTSVRLMFEPNNITLWGNFKGALAPTLDKMKSTQGISDYSIVKLETTDKTKLAAQINIYPMYSVEKFEININITDETVSVA